MARIEISFIADLAGFYNERIEDSAKTGENEEAKNTRKMGKLSAEVEMSHVGGRCARQKLDCGRGQRLVVVGQSLTKKNAIRRACHQQIRSITAIDLGFVCGDGLTPRAWLRETVWAETDGAALKT